MLLDWKEALGSRSIESQKYEPIILKCVECGKRFLFSVAEQKIFVKKGFHSPKRCERCRLRRTFGEEAVAFLADEADEDS